MSRQIGTGGGREIITDEEESTMDWRGAILAVVVLAIACVLVAPALGGCASTAHAQGYFGEGSPRIDCFPNGTMMDGRYCYGGRVFWYYREADWSWDYQPEAGTYWDFTYAWDPARGYPHPGDSPYVVYSAWW